MAKVDSETKKYVSDPTVFADIFNHFIYDGDGVIKPEDLSELDSTTIFNPTDENGKVHPVQKFRDVIKNAVVMEDDDVAYALILGVENQTDIHYAMPVRNMAYDAYTYAAQVDTIIKRNKAEQGNKDNQATQDKKVKRDKSLDFLSGLKKDDKILPVVTLVVYFGQEEWDGPMSVHEMLKIKNPKILKYVPDYRMNLIAPVSMDKAEIDKFTSNFRELAMFIKCAHDKAALQELVENDEGFKHVDSTMANVANMVTQAGLKLKIKKGGQVDMCKAIVEMREDSRNDGRIEGVQEGEKNKAIAVAKSMIADKMPEKMIAKYTGLSVAEVLNLKPSMA